MRPRCDEHGGYEVVVVHGDVSIDSSHTHRYTSLSLTRATSTNGSFVQAECGRTALNFANECAEHNKAECEDFLSGLGYDDDGMAELLESMGLAKTDDDEQKKGKAECAALLEAAMNEVKHTDPYLNVKFT